MILEWILKDTGAMELKSSDIFEEQKGSGAISSSLMPEKLTSKPLD